MDSIIVLYIVMFKVRLLQRWLLVVVPIIGASMLATYFLGLVLGFISNMFIFIVVILYKGLYDTQEGYYDGNNDDTKLSFLYLNWQ